MGKVRKLRKKFKAFCRKNEAISRTKTSDSKKKLKISALPKKEISKYSNIRSTALVPRTKNESRIMDTKEISTKIHQKSHQLLSGTLPVQCGRNSQSTTGVLKLGGNLPDIERPAGQKNSYNRRLKIKAKIDHPRKQNMTKIRQNNLVQDINVFKKTLNEESFLKNPQTVVMNQTLERLSNECSFYSGKKTKNVPK